MSWRGLVRGLLLGASGCGSDEPELPPLRYETEYAVVGVEPAAANPLCGGDLRAIDAQLEFAMTRLGTARSQSLSIYIYGDRSEAPCSDPDFAACFFGPPDTIYAPWEFLNHELVHAAAVDIEFPSLTWDEGNASLLDGERTNKDPNVVLDPSYFERTELVNYATVQHFARYLVESRGWESYLRAIRGEDLTAIYGETAAELTAAYEAEAPYSYPALNPCPFVPLSALGEGAWAESFVLDCASDDATQFEFYELSRVPDAAVQRTVTLEDGTYAFRMTGGEAFNAIRCQLDVLNAQIAEPFTHDIRIEGYGLPNEFRAGQEHRLRVSAGTYALTLASGTLEPTSVELTIQRVGG